MSHGLVVVGVSSADIGADEHARTFGDRLLRYGRPAAVQLAVLVDRGHRELPVRGDYVGKNVPTSKSEFIAVRIPPFDPETEVRLYEV